MVAYVMADACLRPDDGAVSNGDMVGNARLARQNSVMPNGRAAGNPHLRHEEGMFAHDHVVRNVDLIVRFNPLLYPSLTKSGPVDGIGGTNFDIVVNLHDAGLGHF